MPILSVRKPDGTWMDIPAIVGPQGPQGPTGPKGEQGVKGETGVWVGSEAPTDSSYKVWVDPVARSTDELPDSGGNVDPETLKSQFVSVDAQQFTEEQKEQARENISAASAADVAELFVSVPCKNLCNPETVVNGFLTSSDVISTADESRKLYITSDYIEVKPNTKYTVTTIEIADGSMTVTKLRKIVMLYDADKNPISGSYLNIDKQYHVTFDSGSAKYARVSTQAISSVSGRVVCSIQVETGTEYTGFEEYSEDTKTIRAVSPGILYGKKWCACGDSFTIGGYTTEDGFDESVYKYTSGKFAGRNIVYPHIIGLRNNMTVTNLAQGGMTMCNIGGTRENAFSNAVYQKVPTDAEYITLKFGINDHNNNSPVGTIDDEDTTTFYGAWNVVLRYLITNHPFAKIGIIVTNGTTADYTDATLAVAKKWGVAYIDEVNDPTVPLLHRVNREGVSDEVKQLRLEAFRISETNTHPNTMAHEYESTFVEAWLRTL